MISCNENDQTDFRYFPSAEIFDDSIAFASNSDGAILKSVNDFSSWVEVSRHKGVEFIDFFRLNDSIFFASGLEGEVFISMDYGDTWESVNLDLGRNPRVFKSENNVYIASSNSKLYISNELMFNWTRLETPTGVNIKSVFEDDRNYLWIATSNPETSTDTLFFNRDFGQYWFPNYVVEDEIQFLHGSGNQIVLGAANSIHYSDNKGESWSENWKLDKIIQDSVNVFSSQNIFLEKSHHFGNTIVCGGLYSSRRPSVLISRNFGRSWVDLTYEGDWIDFGSRINSINVNASSEFNFSGNNGNILKTTTGGSTWEQIGISN